MKRRCINCEHCYNPIPGSSRIDVQCCGFGLKEGAAPVGEFCPMDGKKLHNLRKEDEQNGFKNSSKTSRSSCK